MMHPDDTAAVGVPQEWADRGFSLRPITADDQSWMRALYATTRAEELAQVSWPEDTKRAFLDHQFAAQHAHYQLHFPSALFLAIEHAEAGPIGRYYLLREPTVDLVVDVCVLPAWRGQGLVTALLRRSQVDAAARGRGMWLHVQRGNAAARRLYERLGFVADDTSVSHVPMRWAPPHSSSVS